MLDERFMYILYNVTRPTVRGGDCGSVTTDFLNKKHDTDDRIVINHLVFRPVLGTTRFYAPTHPPTTHHHHPPPPKNVGSILFLKSKITATTNNITVFHLSANETTYLSLRAGRNKTLKFW